MDEKNESITMLADWSSYHRFEIFGRTFWIMFIRIRKEPLNAKKEDEK